MRRSMVVSLIGRPNVGKSALFNRLMGKRDLAITHNRPGVTRDRHYGVCHLKERESDRDIILVDTGGFYPEALDDQEFWTKKQLKGGRPFFNEMAEHARVAIDESDLVLLVVDAREGVRPFDLQIAEEVRKRQRPFWVLVNKFDSDAQDGDQYEFFQIGHPEEDMIVTSAEHGLGMQELKERLHDSAIEFGIQEDREDVGRGIRPRHEVVGNVAIIGAPNVGKSTLLNYLVGDQRALVSNVAGTTVDPIQAYFSLHFGDDAQDLTASEDAFQMDNLELLKEYRAHLLENQDDESDIVNEDIIESAEIDFDEFVVQDLAALEEALGTSESSDPQGDDASEQSEAVEEEYYNPWRSVRIVDTAGIRRHAQVKDALETQSVYRALKSITESDVVIAMCDIEKGVTHQDRRLIDIALERGKSVVVCLNKFDLMRSKLKDERSKREFLLDLRAQLPWLGFVEILFLSAKTGQFTKRLRRSLAETFMVRHRKVATGQLNRFLKAWVDRNPVVVAKSRGVHFRVKYASQIKGSPPTFLLCCNRSQGIPENFRRYLVNGIRAEFELKNSPVHLILRTGTELERRVKKSARDELRTMLDQQL